MAGARNTVKLNFDTAWEYDPAPESTDHISIAGQYDLFIGGEFVKPNAGKYFDSINPATEKKLTKVAQADQSDIDDAVEGRQKRLRQCLVQDETVRTRQIHLSHSPDTSGARPGICCH